MIAFMIDPFSFGDSEKPDRARQDHLRALTAAIIRILDLAHVLASSGRRIDLAGIDQKIGLLCAQSLDLPPHLGRELIPDLQSAAARIDQLFIILQPAMPPPKFNT
jgi:hypothetical protein